MDVDEAKQCFDAGNAVFVDVRDKEEIQAFGHIPDDVHVPLSLIPLKVDELDKTKTYILYCATGARSQYAREVFKKKGLSNVYNLHGGISLWIERKYPVIKN